MATKLRNKRLNSYLFRQILDISAASVLAYITGAIGSIILNIFLRGVSGRAYEYIFDLRYMRFGGNTNLIVAVILFIMFYLSIVYKKSKSLVAIIDETEIIAGGDLNRIINIESKGDIKTLADNINNISEKLKDVAIEERKAQQTKNDLITNVSHDLRTPLTSIMGYLEIIENDKYRDEIALRYYANIAYEKSKSLNLLINDLFELTKMQNSTMNLNKIDINLVELLGQIVAHFEYQFKSEGMKSRIDFSEDKIIVNADGEKLVRAFENLLFNAIKYGKDGFYVDVITKIEDSMAVIQIINYGEAIPAIDLPFIFDRFYRVEKSRNSNIGGSGLGLAITKNIIELHNGNIKASSDELRTIFEVRLPYNKTI